MNKYSHAFERRFKRLCPTVVVTVIFGATDRLINPKVGQPRREVCFFAFVDTVTIKELRLLHNFTSVKRDILLKKSQKGYPFQFGVGMWRVIHVPSSRLQGQDPRRLSRVPKLLIHRFFPWAVRSIYLDSKRELLKSAPVVAESLLGSGVHFAVAEHWCLSFPWFLLSMWCLSFSVRFVVPKRQ